jgi:hypothetical protein
MWWLADNSSHNDDRPGSCDVPYILSLGTIRIILFVEASKNRRDRPLECHLRSSGGDGSFASSLLSSGPVDQSRSRTAVGRRRTSIMCLHWHLSGLARQAWISMMLLGKQIPVLA